MARSGERCILRPPMTDWSVSALGHPGSRVNVSHRSRFRSLLKPLDKPSPINPTQHGSVVLGAQARWCWKLPLARLAARVGKLARAGRDTSLRDTGARRLRNREDGPTLCPRCRGTLGSLRQHHGKSRRNYGTTTGFPRHSPIASEAQLKRSCYAASSCARTRQWC
jgi:hypothetical protein